jgi:sporulation protein YlmC with PRC-barrel domain
VSQPASTRTRRARTIHLARDLVGRRVVDAAGRSLGHVIDLELRPASDGLAVIGLELGQLGWIDRLNISRPIARRFGRESEPRVVPWDQVERLDESAGAIRLRKG